MAPLPPSRSLQLRRLSGALLGAGGACALARHRPLVPSTLLSALVLSAAASLSALRQDAARWWGLIGAGVGSRMGSTAALAVLMEQRDPAGQLPMRALSVLLLGEMRP